jgi:hypothetical protein
VGFFRKHQRNGERGAVFVEFLIAFIPMFIFFLGITQLAFMYAARGILQFAASKAVRAAIVTEEKPLRDCKNGKDGERSTDSAGGANGLQNPFGKEGASNAGGNQEDTSESVILNKARAGAYLPLAVLAPPSFAYPLVGEGLDSIAGGLGPHTTQFALGYALYNRGNSAITLLDGAGKVIDPPPKKFDKPQPVTVHISYLYYCMVPIASRIMCNPIYDLGGVLHAVDALGDSAEKLKDAMSVQQIIADQGSAINGAIDDLKAGVGHLQDGIERSKYIYNDLIKYGQTPALLAVWLASSARFVYMEGKATLPYQYASYVDVCQDKADR